MALCEATKEALWLQRLLQFLRAIEESKPVTIFEDNNSALSLAQNSKDHSRSKHIDIRYHFVREQAEAGNIDLQYCPTEEMIADVLTKSLPRLKFVEFVKMMGLDSHNP